MSRILDFIRQPTTGGSIGDNLLHQEDEREASFPELPHDPETILVDPHVASAVHCVVERVQSRQRTPHYIHDQSITLTLKEKPFRSDENTSDLEFCHVSLFSLFSACFNYMEVKEIGVEAFMSVIRIRD